MSKLSLINANLIVSSAILKNHYLTIEDNHIAAIGEMSEFSPQGQNCFDCQGQYICPSYIDIHTHGAQLQDAMDATPEALDVMCRFQLGHGVGTFLPTTLTAPLRDVQQLLLLLREYSPPVPVCIPGVHMEGPFLSVINRGAQPEEYLLSPDEESMRFVAQYKDMIKLITVSPDVANIVPLIEHCRKNGIVVSGGHDASIDDEIYAAKAAGMSGITHIFCCSSTVCRRPGNAQKHLGLTEIGLLCDDLYVEAIADNCHLPPALLQLLYKVKGWNNICLVSDSISAAGMSPGSYMLGSSSKGVQTEVTDKVALVKGRNLFAGSITPLDLMVQNVVSAGIPLAHAASMAAETPARVLSLAGLGKLVPGYAAKLNIIDAQGKLLAVVAGTDYFVKTKDCTL